MRKGLFSLAQRIHPGQREFDPMIDWTRLDDTIKWLNIFRDRYPKLKFMLISKPWLDHVRSQT